MSITTKNDKNNINKIMATANSNTVKQLMNTKSNIKKNFSKHQVGRSGKLFDPLV